METSERREDTCDEPSLTQKDARKSMSVTAVAKNGGELAKWVSILSSALGLLIYVVHCVQIHYVPVIELSSIAGIFVLMFLVGSFVFAYFILLAGLPAYMWAKTLPQLTVNKNVGDAGWRKQLVSKSDEIFSGLAFLVTGVAVIAVLLSSWSDSPPLWFVPVLLISLFAVVGLGTYCSDRKILGRKGDLLWATFIRSLALLVASLAVIFAVMVSASPGYSGVVEYEIKVRMVFGGFVVVVAECMLVSVLQSPQDKIARAGLGFGGACLIAMLIAGTTLVDMTVRALGLGLVTDVSLSLDSSLAQKATAAGFECKKSEKANRKVNAQHCTISGVLVTRIGTDFVMMRNEDWKLVMEPKSKRERLMRMGMDKYLIIPKSNAMVVPSSKKPVPETNSF